MVEFSGDYRKHFGCLKIYDIYGDNDKSLIRHGAHVDARHPSP